MSAATAEQSMECGDFQTEKRHAKRYDVLACFVFLYL